MADLFRILSIDGGGVRGVIPATILVTLERKLQDRSGSGTARIADYFDLVAGTSSGGMSTCVYLYPDKETGRPKYSATDAQNFFLQYSEKIFDRSLGRDLVTWGGLWDERYSAEGLEEVLASHLGECWLSELLRPSLITAYDIENRKAHFFKKHRTPDGPRRDFRLRDVARATSAAPTYFECARVEARDGKAFALVDGGMFAGNPALCAFAEGRKEFGRRAEDMVILSLGAGSYEKRYPYRKAKDWGKAGWAVPAFDIITSGVAETVDYELEQIYAAVGCAPHYLRVQPTIAAENARLDDPDADNLSELRRDAENIAANMDAALDDFVTLLMPVP